jgi:ubiquitin-like-conjugating enzyme ATG3
MAHTSIAARLYHEVGAMFTPVLTSSKFVDDGVLNPEEFVAAGDALIRVSPLWQW